MAKFFQSTLWAPAQRQGRHSRRRPRKKAAGSRTGRRFESLESKNLLASVPFGAQADDTAIYMIGEVNVNVVFLESDGSLDASTEDWTESHKNEVKQNIVAGLEWWEDVYDATGLSADLHFNIDFTYADSPVATRYEPISRISNHYTLWVDEFLTHTGHQTSDGLGEDIRGFNHAQRLEHETNWSFTIFVVNSENDEALNGSGNFAPGGSHSRAFAFAGGLFFVTPSTRPVSTYSHETGHMFYAYDEYSGSASYTSLRGYLNAQNTNGYTSHPNPAARQLSIMDAHELAYPLHAVSDGARDIIGWRDTDSDGIADILDVPHKLSGVGRYDPATSTYFFNGHSEVATLPNLNSWDLSLQSDITLNRLSRVQYRLDGGSWQTAATLDAYSADLSLEISDIPPSASQIEIRTIDDHTGVASPTFAASLAQPAATALPGANGFVWNDANANGVWDAGESPLPGWTVALLDSAGQPIAPPLVVEADDFEQNETLNHAIPQATLSADGFGVWEDTVRARDRDGGSPGERVLKHFIGSGWSSSWVYGNAALQDNRQLRIDFTSPVTTVSIDAIANSDHDFGRLEIYDASGSLLGRYTTAELAADQIETMTLGVDSPRIAYALASGHANTGVDLDNLQFNAANVVHTAAGGNYSAAYLPPGDYRLQLQAEAGFESTTPLELEVTLSAGGAISDLNFGVVSTGPIWQNPEMPLDVDQSGLITLHDALLVVAELRRRGPQPLEGEPTSSDSPLVDTNGDGVLTISDALEIVLHLRRESSPGGEGEASLAAAAQAASALTGEGEGEQILFKLETTDLAGNPISTIAAGQQFLLKAYVQDLRPASFPERGIQVAFLDVLYDAGRVAPVATSGAFPIDITFSPDFQHTPDLFGASPGLIDDVGAIQTNPGAAEPLGAGEVLLFTVRFNAVTGGNVLFQADDPDEPGNTINFFEPPQPEVDPTLVIYGTTALTVTQSFTAHDDSYSVGVNSGATALAVRQNDIASGAFSVQSVGPTSSGGAVTIAPGGTHVNYTPPAGFTGFDAFNYTIGSGSTASTARVQVTVGDPTPPYRNPSNPLDVDVSGAVTLNDALIVVSDLRSKGGHVVVLPPTPASSPPPYLDVSGDNRITISDALQIVLHLRNLLSNGEAEPPAEAQASPVPASGDLAAQSFDEAFALWNADENEDTSLAALLASMASSAGGR